MRGEETLYGLIDTVAHSYAAIRAVILNGSRANPECAPDKLQDYDLLFVVEEVAPFVADKSWLNPFGKTLIKQEPDWLDNTWPQVKDRYAFLMLFEDGNRIDLTLVSTQYFEAMHKDSLSKVLIDKGSFKEAIVSTPSLADYLPVKPSKHEFVACCNEFFWVVTYVAKGLCRAETIYAMTMLETVVRPELIKLLTWSVAEETKYLVNLGKCSKYLPNYLAQSQWEQFKNTYTDAESGNIWQALSSMCELFDDTASLLAEKLKLTYDSGEASAVIGYIHRLQAEYE